MDLISAQAASLISRPEASTLTLQINQRFAAEVLNVADDQVTLVLEGTPFVARLTSVDQAAALQGQRFANFVVRENTGNVVQLQLLPRPGTTPETPVETGKAASTLIPNLLRMAGLPTSDTNSTIAQALIRQGLPVNAELVNELNSALANISGWGQFQANQAAMLKAAGLPLTPETLVLALAQNNVTTLTEMINALKGKLAQAIKENPQKAAQLQDILHLLDQMSLNWDTSDVQQLQQALAFLGRPIESELAKFLRQNLPALNAFSGQAAFEQALAEFLQNTFPFLSADERAALQSEIMQMLQNNPSLLEADGQAALERELAKLIQSNPSGQPGLTPLENMIPQLVQKYANALGTPEGQAAFEHDLLTYLQNLLPPSKTNAEMENVARQAMQLVRDALSTLNTPEGQAQLQEQLAQLLQSTSFSAEEQASLVDELTQLIQHNLKNLDTPEGQSALEQNLARLLQGRASSLPNADMLELSQHLQSRLSSLSAQEDLALVSRDITRIVQGHLLTLSSDGRTGLQQGLAQFLQTNGALMSAEARALLEQDMARLLQDKNAFLQSPESQAGLMTLARLRGGLSGSGMDALLKEMDNLLGRMRWMQFENAPPQGTPLKEQWLAMELPLLAGAQLPGQTQQPLVQLRVAYQSEGKKRKIDPNNTHIMLHFDLGIKDEFVDVDLAVVERKIGAQITVSNTDIQPIAEDEIPNLEEGLEQVGYLLQTARCDLAKPKPLQTTSTEAQKEYVPDYVGKLNLRA